MNLWQAKPKAKSKAKAKAKASVKGRGKGRGRQVKGNGKGQHVEQEEHMPPQNEDEQLEQLEMEAEDLDVSPQDQDVPMLAAPEAIAPSPSLPFGHPDESPSNVPAEDVAVVPAAVAEAAAIPDVHMQDDVAADPEEVPAVIHEEPPAVVPAVPAALFPEEPHAAVPAAAVPEEPPAAVPAEAAVPAAAAPDEPPAAVPAEAAVPAAAAPDEPPAAVPAPAAVRAAPRVVAARENFSPDVLARLAPPLCYIGSDVKAHRWKMKFRVPRVEWADRCESFSRAFVNKPSLEALKEVHFEAWDRWQLVRDDDAFRCEHPQEPGVIPDELIPDIQAYVDLMPASVNYSRK